MKARKREIPKHKFYIQIRRLQQLPDDKHGSGTIFTLIIAIFYQLDGRIYAPCVVVSLAVEFWYEHMTLNKNVTVILFIRFASSKLR
jgi:hypothetical protein